MPTAGDLAGTFKGGVTMKAKQIDKDMVEVSTADGSMVLFSYDKPVAARLPDQRYYRTATRWHLTTSKHVRKWLRSKNTHAKRVEDSFFDSLLGA